MSSGLTTMRRSPRRPLILRRRKLPFQQNNPPAAEPQKQPAADPKQPPGSSSGWCFPDGIRVLDHPCMSDTKVVVIPKTADVQNVIQALSAKGKESGPSKFILLGGNAGPAAAEDGGSARKLASHPLEATSNQPVTALKTRRCSRPCFHPACSSRSTSDLWSLVSSVNKDLECRPLDDSLASIQSLQAVGSCAAQPEAQPPPGQQTPDEDSENQDSQASCSFLPGFSMLVHVNGISLVLPQQAKGSDEKAPAVERPPYSYMALIQFAINSQRSRKMTLKEIYTWIEDRFPYFRQAAKKGWKVPARTRPRRHETDPETGELTGSCLCWQNSIRHNLSLHDMFIRETTSDGKISYWTIRPEANRCITLDQVCKVSSCRSLRASAAAESRTAELRLLVLRVLLKSFKMGLFCISSRPRLTPPLFLSRCRCFYCPSR